MKNLTLILPLVAFCTLCACDMPTGPAEPPPADKPTLGAPLRQEDPSTGAKLQISREPHGLQVLIRNFPSALDTNAEYALYVGTRYQASESGPTYPPRRQRAADPPNFRWHLISDNPLPSDGINANPRCVHVLPIGRNHRPATAIEVFLGHGAANEWETRPGVLLSRSPMADDDLELLIPWESIASGTEGAQPDAFLDVVVVLYNETTWEIDLAFPVENGKGPKALLSYAFSFPPDRSASPINTADTDFSAVVIDDDFSEETDAWRVISDAPAEHWAGRHKVSAGVLRLNADEDASCGLYHEQSFGGTFDVQADFTLVRGKACGLTLYKDRHGLPDRDQFLRVERGLNEEGKKVVRVYARRNRESMVEVWWQKKLPHFEYVLEDEEFGREALALRISRDERSGCLRFYYKYARTVDAVRLEGWMEFPTLSDWDSRSFFVSPYVRSDSGEATATFDRISVRNTRRDDVSDADTGFGATRRDYTFSGVNGDAVVVTFDEAFPFHDTAKFVFWREANYIPWWHIDSKCALSYEFAETWGGGTTWKGKEPGGCCEPMSDRLNRWSAVDIVEQNEVRVIVRWQYVLTNPEYQWWGLHPTEKPLVEERFCFYPDGTGVRTLTYRPVLASEYERTWNEISEPMLVHRGGVYPSECLSRNALSMLNLQGERKDYVYLVDPPQRIGDDEKYWDEAIARINLNRRPSVYIAFAQSDETYKKTFPGKFHKGWWGKYLNDWHVGLRGGYEYEGDFWPFAHWPISRIPYDDHTKTMGKWLREPGHTSVLSVPGHEKAPGPLTWAMLIGLAPAEDDDGVRRRVSSWLYPGKVRMLNDSSVFVENDYDHRSLVFDNAKGDQLCAFVLTPDPVVVHPVFVVRNWGDQPVTVRMGDDLLSPDNYRFAISDGAAVVWIDGVIQEEITVVIEGR